MCSEYQNLGTCRTVECVATTYDYPKNVARAVHSLSLLSSKVYVFSEDCDNIDDLMLSHGLHGETLSTEECTRTLCFHILTGLCARIPADSNLKRSACDDISGSSDPPELELAMSNAVIDEVALIVRISHLRTLCSAIGVSDNKRASRRSLIDLLQKRHKNLERFPHDRSVCGLFDSFQYMDRPGLVNVAVVHGLSVDARSTVDDLKGAIIAHVTCGECVIDRTVNDQPTSQCHSTAEEFEVGNCDGVCNWKRKFQK
jgi:hypothetical protein